MGQCCSYVQRNDLNQKLDILPSEMLLHITEFVGKDSCYLSLGLVSKRFNQLFHTYSKKLSKTTSYGGYVKFDDIVKQCEIVLKSEDKYIDYECELPDICYRLASGAVTFNRTELLEWTLISKSSIFFQAVCERAIKDGKLYIMKKVWDSIEDKNLLSYMKSRTKFIDIAAEEGDLNSLRYLHEENGCEWSYTACTLAAGQGHLDCLIYLHEHGYEWTLSACVGAVLGGNLDCLLFGILTQTRV